MTFKAYESNTYSSGFYHFKNEGIEIQIDDSPELCNLSRFFLKIKGYKAEFEGAFMPLFSQHHRYTCRQKRYEDYRKLSLMFKALKKDPSDMSARKSLEDIIFECVFETLKQIPPNWYLGGTLPSVRYASSANIRRTEGSGRKYMSITNHDFFLYDYNTIDQIPKKEQTAYRNTLCRMKSDEHSKGMDRQVFDSGRAPFRLKGIEKKRFKEAITSIGGLEGWLEVEAYKISKRYMEILFT